MILCGHSHIIKLCFHGISKTSNVKVQPSGEVRVPYQTLFNVKFSKKKCSTYWCKKPLSITLVTFKYGFAH